MADQPANRAMSGGQIWLEMLSNPGCVLKQNRERQFQVKSLFLSPIPSHQPPTVSTPTHSCIFSHLSIHPLLLCVSPSSSLICPPVLFPHLPTVLSSLVPCLTDHLVLKIHDFHTLNICTICNLIILNSSL